MRKILFALLAMSALQLSAATEMHHPADTIKPLELKKLDKTLPIDKIRAIEPEEKSGTKKIKAKKERQAPKPQKENNTAPTKATPPKGTGTGKTNVAFGIDIDSMSRMAEYPGGGKAIREFIRKNKRYPEECRAARVAGKVEVSITIAPDGTQKETKIAKSSGNRYMDAEALRVAGIMPAWKPAKDIANGLERIYTMKMTFRPGR